MQSRCFRSNILNALTTKAAQDEGTCKGTSQTSEAFVSMTISIGGGAEYNNTQQSVSVGEPLGRCTGAIEIFHAFLAGAAKWLVEAGFERAETNFMAFTIVISVAPASTPIIPAIQGQRNSGKPGLLPSLKGPHIIDVVWILRYSSSWSMPFATVCIRHWTVSSDTYCKMFRKNLGQSTIITTNGRHVNLRMLHWNVARGMLREDAGLLHPIRSSYSNTTGTS